jgi:hypothetical protein
LFAAKLTLTHSADCVRSSVTLDLIRLCFSAIEGKQLAMRHSTFCVFGFFVEKLGTPGSRICGIEERVSEEDRKLARLQTTFGLALAFWRWFVCRSKSESRSGAVSRAAVVGSG